MEYGLFCIGKTVLPLQGDSVCDGKRRLYVYLLLVDTDVWNKCDSFHPYECENKTNLDRCFCMRAVYCLDYVCRAEYGITQHSECGRSISRLKL